MGHARSHTVQHKQTLSAPAQAKMGSDGPFKHTDFQQVADAFQCAGFSVSVHYVTGKRCSVVSSAVPLDQVGQEASKHTTAVVTAVKPDADP